MTTLSHCRPDVKHLPGDCNLCDFYEGRSKDKNLRFPHCDAYVVHAPNNCKYCDEYAADMQQWRQQHGVNFTGETYSTKTPCPATARRKADVINKWYGNVPCPKPNPKCNQCGAEAVYINLGLGCPKGHGPC